MKTGTKTLLFGGHQFLLHPALVWLAWVAHYHRLPNPKEAICIAIHDLGYWGKPNVDGPEGETHPEWAGWWAREHLDWPSWTSHYYRDLCWGHSRFYARSRKMPVSKLCVVDKLGVSYMPAWLWYVLCRLSGELTEYMSCEKYADVEREIKKNPRQWFIHYRKAVQKWANDPNWDKNNIITVV